MYDCMTTESMEQIGDKIEAEKYCNMNHFSLHEALSMMPKTLHLF